MSLRIERGFADKDRTAVAELYWEAFGGKLVMVGVFWGDIDQK